MDKWITDFQTGLMRDRIDALEEASTEEKADHQTALEILKAENARLRAVHEAELGVCEEYCEVVAQLREALTAGHQHVRYWAGCEVCELLGRKALDGEGEG